MEMIVVSASATSKLPVIRLLTVVIPCLIVDTYRIPPACPDRIYERKTLKDIGRDFQRLLGH